MPLRNVQGDPTAGTQERRFPKVRAVLAPWLVLIVGLGTSFLFAKQISDAALVREEARFETAVEEARATLESNAEQHELLLRAAAGLFVAEDVSADDFASFVTRLQLADHFPAISGMGYASVVPAPEQPADQPDQDHRNQAIVRYFVQPSAAEPDILGRDLRNGAAMQQALATARDTGEVVITAPLVIALPGVTPDAPARHAVIAPVYQGDPAPVSVEDRRALLEGYVFAPLDLNVLIERSIARQAAAGVEVDVYDAANPQADALLVSTRDGAPAAAREFLVRRERPVIVDRAWLVVFSAGPDFERSPQESLASSVVMIGAGISVLLFVLLHRDALMRRRSELVHADLLKRERAARTEAQSALDLLAMAEDAARAGVWEIEVPTHNATWSDSLYRIFGVEADDFRPTLENWILCIHGEDRGKVRDTVQSAIDNHGGLNVEYRVPHAELGDRWLLQVGETFGMTEVGRPLRMAGIVLDITARKEWEEHQKLLLAELNHRVKNTLAIVQSIASQTTKHSESLDTFREAFEGRLRALAKAHGLITQSHWKSIDLRSLVHLALAPYANERGDNFVLEGPGVALRTSSALALSMILHELGTNAAKYGALSVPSGGIEVRWKLLENGGARSVHLTWRETGGPPVVITGRRGFGSTLIERSVEYDLTGHALLDYRPEGLWCEIIFPLATASASAAALERVHA
jgi:two-component sensor histidine kinase/CHASE1-domain containing sensor protein